MNRHPRRVRSSRARRAAAALAVPVLLVAGLTGCDNENDSNAPNQTESTLDVDTPTDTTPSTPSESTESTGSESAGPTGTAGSSQSPPPSTHDTSSPARAKQSQVSAADFPGFNDQWTWDDTRVSQTEPTNGPAMSRCARGSLTAIGGVAVYSTTYLSDASKQDQARLSVAVFPDEKTATMAESVLKSWLTGCRAHLARQAGVDQVGVTSDIPVQTSVGTGHERIVSFGPVPGDPDSRYFNGEGYVRDGDVISYVVFHNVGQDYNYEQGEEPAAQALEVAAGALESSR